VKADKFIEPESADSESFKGRNTGQKKLRDAEVQSAA